MAGPIRELLARQPVRNAIRRMVGVPERYGFMGDRMAAASTSDDMQGTNLMSGMRRIGGRRNRSASQVPTTNTTARPVAPSPEAQAVNMARQQDEERRISKRKASEGLLPAPAQPVAQTAPAPAVQPGEPVAQESPLSPLLSRVEQLRQQAAALHQEAQRRIGPSPTPVSIAAAGPLLERAGRLEGMAALFETQQLAQDAEAKKQAYDRETAVLVEQTRGQSAVAAQREEANPYRSVPEMARVLGLQGAVDAAVATQAGQNSALDKEQARNAAMEEGLAGLMGSAIQASGGLSSQDNFVAEVAQEAVRRFPSSRSTWFGWGANEEQPEAQKQRLAFVSTLVRRYLEAKQMRGEKTPPDAYPKITRHLHSLVEKVIQQNAQAEQ